MARLIVESGPLRGTVFPLPDDRRVGVGRDPECLLQLPDQQSSRVHCVIQAIRGEFGIADRKSQNGTWVNGKRIEKAFLKPGDVVRVGQTFLSYMKGDEDPLIGRDIAGHKVVARLGRGAMGTVYRAHQSSLDRDVALKILSQTLVEDRRFITRFLEEARAAGKLNHPNVVQVHDVGQSGELFYISMEYMERNSLQSLLDTQGKLPEAEAITMILHANEALIWAEEHGIVHRDIKPDNLLVDSKGVVKIGDFGIALDQAKSKTLYESGKIVGTPIYMAPEQARGKKVDHRADIYALGATLYHALSGEQPFKGNTPV